MRRGLASSPEAARSAVAAGQVVVSGGPATTAARLVGSADPVRVLAPGPPFVSRGGQKLAAALDQFQINAAGRSTLDAGSSTGGFTDCLLQRGAASVAAVDVGRGQLRAQLRSDPRVAVHERTDIRSFDAVAAGGPFDLVVADLSFISVRSVLDELLACCVTGGDLVVLVKPQFEVTQAEASRGRGVISDPALWGRVLAEVGEIIRSRGAAIMDVMASPLRGARGNVEFLVRVAGVDATGVGH